MEIFGRSMVEEWLEVEVGGAMIVDGCNSFRTGAAWTPALPRIKVRMAKRRSASLACRLKGRLQYPSARRTRHACMSGRRRLERKWGPRLEGCLLGDLRTVLD